jgi:hypothetical protein
VLSYSSSTGVVVVPPVRCRVMTITAPNSDDDE